MVEIPEPSQWQQAPGWFQMQEAMCLGVHAQRSRGRVSPVVGLVGVILPPGFAPFSQASISWAGMVGERKL